MTLRLAGKTTLITGAAGGIGRATATLFANHGANVVCVDMNAVENKRTVELVTEAGGTAIAITANVAEDEAVRAMIARTVDTFGGLHVLFNNAGIMHHADGDTQTTEGRIWDLTMDINAKGVFLGCKYGIPAMLASGGGSIINTASFVAVVGSATPQIAYTASKGAVLAMTRELAVIHARQGIRVNALCPGPLRTELLMSFLDTEEKKRRRLVHVPLARFGEAEEMAAAVLFLASDESSYVTGTDFMVDGGLTAAYVTPE